MDDPDNTFQILLATDIHLGYGENNSIRDNDTFVTFEEILQIAVKESVDFILLGGDLFHETRPSTYCILKCSELIRKYCFGDKPVEIEFLSDPSFNFQHDNTVNYEDPNVNISIPIFSIHGNHDDPTGKKQTSAMDLMSSNRLINYFGRWDDLTRVEVSPILLKKGESRLALYGLSHIRDERLARLFLDKKVIMKTPEQVDEWFNIMILHQNRANRGVKNFIAETFIPDFMDLVMWGHEHDCRIEATPVAQGRAYITQPGSSVATSLAEGEALTKKVGLLKVNGRDFSITPIELKTVRPFVNDTMHLDPPEGIEGKVTHASRAQELVKGKIEEMIDKANNLGRRNDMLPLIRLVVKYLDERQVFNAIRFGQGFADKVANPEDIVKFSSLQKKTRRARNLDDEEMEDVDGEQADRVEDLIKNYFNENHKLKVLSVTGLNEAVRRFIDSNDIGAPEYIINKQEESTLQKLLELQPEEDDVEACLERLRLARNPEEEADLLRNLLNDPTRLNAVGALVGDDVVSIDDSDDDSGSTSTPTKKASGSTSARPASGPGSRGGRGSRGGKGSRGPRGGLGKAK